MLMQTTPQRGRVRVGSQARVQDVCEGAPLGPTPAGGRRRKQWQSEKASCDAGPNLPTLKETLEPDCPSEMSGVGWDDQPLPHPPASHWMGITWGRGMTFSCSLQQHSATVEGLTVEAVR